jgi:hypothetical protein
LRPASALKNRRVHRRARSGDHRSAAPVWLMSRRTWLTRRRVRVSTATKANEPLSRGPAAIPPFSDSSGWPVATHFCSLPGTLLRCIFVVTPAVGLLQCIFALCLARCLARSSCSARRPPGQRRHVLFACAHACCSACRPRSSNDAFFWCVSAHEFSLVSQCGRAGHKDKHTRKSKTTASTSVMPRGREARQ